ncbi:MAG: sugar phosphate isomerase/epimerase, partial [Clostridia bacterium]|nr:sugar phosphate isomerase/epimerase [Clostridia bacterium]
GIFLWFGYPVENKRRLKLIKEAGFDSVTLWWGDEYTDIDGDKYLLPDLARNAGLDIEHIHTPYSFANELWNDSLDGIELMRIYNECITSCHKYDMKTAVIHAFSGRNQPEINDLGLDRIKDLCDYAAKMDVDIALENIREPSKLEKIFASITHPNLGLCYDSGHENCYSFGTDLLTTYKDRIKALHLHDNDGKDDQHRIIGEGNINWEKVKRKIEKRNYKGAVTLEVSNEFSKLYKEVDIEEFLRISYIKLCEVFQR